MVKEYEYEITMQLFTDYRNRVIRFTDERIHHLEYSHPEMYQQIEKIKETLFTPDYVMESKTYKYVQLFYKHYESTPVNSKYLCVVVKFKDSDNFVITSYFTDAIKKGKRIWRRK